MILFQYGHFCQKMCQSQKILQSSDVVLNQDTDWPNCLAAWLSLLRGREGSYTQIPLSLNLLESRIWIQIHPLLMFSDSPLSSLRDLTAQNKAVICGVPIISLYHIIAIANKDGNHFSKGTFMKQASVG